MPDPLRRRSDTRYLKRRVGKRRSGDRWYVRVPVPRDLRGRFGKLDAIERGLNTGDLREAQRRRHAVVAAILERFEQARRAVHTSPEAAGGATPTARSPSGPGAIGEARRAELRKAWRTWSGFIGELGLSAAREALADDIFAESMPDDDGTLTLSPSEHWLERAAGNERMAEALLEAHIAGAEMAIEGREPPAAPGRAGAGVRGLAPLYLAERAASLTKQTAAQQRATFRLFADFTGNAALDAVSRRDAADFLDTLARLDPHYGRRPGAAELVLDQLLKLYPVNGRALTPRTLNRHLSALNGLWRWARRRGHIAEDRSNPFSEQMRERPRGQSGWLAYTVDELAALFAGATFDRRPARHSLATALPWIMAIALYGGMRQGEICDLDAEDVREQDGVAYFDVTAAKSEAGVRRVPVHSQLVRLGVLDYVAAIGSGPLFPGLALAGPDRKRAHTLAKRFPAYRRQRGVTRERLTFHSFRKCFVRALELAGVDRDRAALVVGHERGFTFRVYNPEGVDVVKLREVVELVSYPGLELG